MLVFVQGVHVGKNVTPASIADGSAGVALELLWAIATHSTVSFIRHVCAAAACVNSGNVECNSISHYLSLNSFKLNVIFYVVLLYNISIRSNALFKVLI